MQNIYFFSLFIFFFVYLLHSRAMAFICLKSAQILSLEVNFLHTYYKRLNLALIYLVLFSFVLFSSFICALYSSHTLIQINFRAVFLYIKLDIAVNNLSIMCFFWVCNSRFSLNSSLKCYSVFVIGNGWCFLTSFFSHLFLNTPTGDGVNCVHEVILTNENPITYNILFLAWIELKANNSDSYLTLCTVPLNDLILLWNRRSRAGILLVVFLSR